jgi:hypothetical protein
MTDREQQVNEIMQRVASDHRIPTEVAQVFLLVAKDLLDQANLSKELATTVRRQGDAITRLGKEIDRLRGTHGA